MLSGLHIFLFFYCRPHTAGTVKLTDDGFSDSSSDEDSNAVSTVATEKRNEGRYFMLGM